MSFDIEEIMAGIVESWNIRTERLEHDHIFQVEDPFAHGKWPTCPACKSINPRRMTINYANKARFASAGGWG